MKKILFILAISSLLLSCSSSGHVKAVKNFTENMAKGKTEEAKKYATESTAQMLSLVSSMGAGEIDPNFEFELVKDSVVDKKAWVTFINQKGKEETVEVVKIDGKWLVHMDMQK